MKELSELNAIYQKMSTQEVDEAMVVTNADKKGNTPAYQNFKKGMKKKDGTPMYKAADHMKEESIDEKMNAGLQAYIDKKKGKKTDDKEENGNGKKGKASKGSKPDFLDLDGDGNKTEPMKSASKSKKEETEYNYVSQYLENAPRMQKGAMAYDGPNKEASEAKDRVMAKAKARKKPTVTIDKPDKLVSMKVSKEGYDALIESGNFSELEIQRIIFDDFEESREYSHNPEKYHDSQGRDKKLEADKPYRQRSRAARMRDPERGINSPAFKKFMADRGM